MHPFVRYYTSERVLWWANRCAENYIVICHDVLIPRRVTRVRYFFKEQRIRGPIELPLKQVDNAYFCTDEIVHKEL